MNDQYSNIKSKWICLYLAKGRSRFLDIYKLYFDGGLEKFPAGSICLDDPFVMLDPSHPRYTSILPSEIARSCDLFSDDHCYRILELVEARISHSGLFTPTETTTYVVTEVDRQFRPAEVIGLKYHEAMTLFSDHAASLRLPGNETAHDPSGSLCLKFAAHAADMRTPPQQPPNLRQNFRTTSNFIRH